MNSQKVPEWLVDLENKRERKKGSRLGHEIGANAKCNVCGDSCPGLDLHFWRKTCKNCKCRKEDHDIHDDELSWAQFEILGQMKSKPGCELYIVLYHLFSFLELILLSSHINRCENISNC